MKKNRSKLNTAALIMLGVLALYIPWSWLPVQVIIGEDSGQKFLAMIGVGEVIRIRRDFEAFSVLKKDFIGFSKNQSFSTRMKAQAAWFLSRFTNLTRGATHFENIRRFGLPHWADQMTQTSQLDDLVFFKKKAGGAA